MRTRQAAFSFTEGGTRRAGSVSDGQHAPTALAGGVRRADFAGVSQKIRIEYSGRAGFACGLNVFYVCPANGWASFGRPIGGVRRRVPRRHTFHPRKGKPVARRGRKATGLRVHPAFNRRSPGCRRDWAVNTCPSLECCLQHSPRRETRIIPASPTHTPLISLLRSLPIRLPRRVPFTESPRHFANLNVVAPSVLISHAY